MDQGTYSENENNQICYSCMRHAALTCPIILPSIIKILIMVTEVFPGKENKVKRALLQKRIVDARPPTFIILINRVFHWKTWLKMKFFCQSGFWNSFYYQHCSNNDPSLNFDFST